MEWSGSPPSGEGGCVGRAAVTGLHWCHGRVHRSGALPGAVREPLPPRLPRQVPRVRARDRLVARQPGRARRRLPDRLRDHPRQERRDPALPALSPVGDRLLDLLRGVAPDGGPLAGRERRPDPEGALPAAVGGVLGGRDPGGHVRGDARDPDRPLADLHPGRAGDGLARAPARAAVRGARRRDRARRRVRSTRSCGTSSTSWPRRSSRGSSSPRSSGASRRCRTRPPRTRS